MGFKRSEFPDAAERHFIIRFRAKDLVKGNIFRSAFQTDSAAGRQPARARGNLHYVLICVARIKGIFDPQINIDQNHVLHVH